MQRSVFRQKSLEKISSPQQMNDYIRVSSPSVWMILAAVIVLLIGVCVWGVFGCLDTAVQTGGVCTDGRLTVLIGEKDYDKITGDTIIAVDGIEYTIARVMDTPIQADDRIAPYAVHLADLSAGNWVYELYADAPELPDGVYAVSVITERIRPLDFVWN